jgi:3-polyprenyl-4-hydroxybenzoate decarboxylase
MTTQPTVNAAVGLAADQDRRRAEGDLREFLRLAEEGGHLVTIHGAHPDLEIGPLYELSLERELPPVLLFRPDQGPSA